MKLFPKKNEEKTTKISLGTMYDINKDLVSKINDLTKEQLEEKKNLVIEFLENTDNHYYMLLEYIYYLLYLDHYLIIL